MDYVSELSIKGKSNYCYSPFLHFKMYKVVAFVLFFAVIATTYGFKLEANEPSTRKEGKELILFFTLVDPADFLGHLKV